MILDANEVKIAHENVEEAPKKIRKYNGKWDIHDCHVCISALAMASFLKIEFNIIN